MHNAHTIRQYAAYGVGDKPTGRVSSAPCDDVSRETRAAPTARVEANRGCCCCCCCYGTKKSRRPRPPLKLKKKGEKKTRIRTPGTLLTKIQYVSFLMPCSRSTPLKNRTTERKHMAFLAAKTCAADYRPRRHYFH